MADMEITKIADGSDIPLVMEIPTINGEPYDAKNGVWDTSYTGLAQYHVDGKWYYIRPDRPGRYQAYAFSEDFLKALIDNDLLPK